MLPPWERCSGIMWRLAVGRMVLLGEVPDPDQLRPKSPSAK